MITNNLKKKIIKTITQNGSQETKNQILNIPTFKETIDINLLEILKTELGSDSIIINIWTWHDLILVFANYNNNENGSILIFDSNFKLIKKFTQYIENGQNINFNKFRYAFLDKKSRIHLLQNNINGDIQYSLLNDIITNLFTINQLFFVKELIIIPKDSPLNNFLKIKCNIDNNNIDLLNVIFYYQSNKTGELLQYSFMLNQYSLSEKLPTQTIDNKEIKFNHNMQGLYDFNFFTTTTNDKKTTGRLCASFRSGTQQQELLNIETKIDELRQDNLESVKTEIQQMQSNPKTQEFQILDENNQPLKVNILEIVNVKTFTRTSSSGSPNYITSYKKYTQYLDSNNKILISLSNSYTDKSLNDTYKGFYYIKFKYKFKYLETFYSKARVDCTDFSFNDNGDFSLSNTYSTDENLIDVGNVCIEQNTFLVSMKEKPNNIFNIYRFWVDGDQLKITNLNLNNTSTNQYFISSIYDYSDQNFEDSIIAFSTNQDKYQLCSNLYKSSNETLFNRNATNFYEVPNFKISFLFGTRQQNLIKIFAFNLDFSKIVVFQNSYDNQTPDIDPYQFLPYDNENNNFLSQRVLATFNNELEFDGTIGDIPSSQNSFTLTQKIDYYSLNDVENDKWYIYSNTNNEMFLFNESVKKTRNQSVNLNFDITFNIIDKTNNNIEQIKQDASNNFVKMFSQKGLPELISNNIIDKFVFKFSDGTEQSFPVKDYLIAQDEIAYINASIFNSKKIFINNIIIMNKSNNELVNKVVNIPPNSLLNLSIKVEILNS